MEKKKFNYFAFISYKREDEKWAKWLQNKLETYRIPAVIRKENQNVPKKLYPIFRDKTDLSSGKVMDQLHKELEESQYLIVICSPNSASSKWVDAEIRHFVDIGREDFIIPFIVDGEPFSKDKKRECYPSALRESVKSEILGISASELGKHQAFLRTVSALLNLKFDQLVMRDRRRHIRKRILACWAILSVMIYVSSIVWYVLPHSSYYHSYVYVNEVPVGMNKVSSVDRSQLSECYEIVKQKGKIIQLKRINPAGKPVKAFITTFIEDAPIINFYYEDEKISRAEFCNEHGKVLLLKDYSSNLKAVDFIQSEDASQPMTLSADQTGANEAVNEIGFIKVKSDITRHINTYDSKGYLIRVQFMRDNLNTPAKDSNGIFGKAYERDEEGRIVKLTYLDEDGKPRSSRSGVAGWQYEYNSKGKLIKSNAFDSEGNKTRGENGFSMVEIYYDDVGNVTEIDLKDIHGKLCTGDDGVAVQKVSYDSEGYLSRVCFYDAEGEPAYNIEDNVHGFNLEYDDRGNPCKIEYIDSNGELMICSRGYASQEGIYDHYYMMQERYYDKEGKPVREKGTGSYGVNYLYDKDGNIIEVVHLNAQGIPEITREGFAYIHRRYNEAGQLIEESYGDAQDHPIRIRSLNISSIEYIYDRKGNPQEVLYKDEENKLCLNEQGYARSSFEFDEAGNCIRESYFDDNNTPTIINEGYASVTYEYDYYGNCVRVSYYDTEDMLINLSDYYAVAEMEYDKVGNTVKYTYYDKNLNPAQCEGKYHQLIKTYDNSGNCIREEGYLSETYTTISYTYNSDQQLQKVEFLQGDFPGTDENSIYAYLYEYDFKGRKIREEVKNANGGTDNLQGYTEIETIYNDENYVESIYYYINGEVCDRITYLYDEYGNCIRQAYQDKEGNPKLQEYGAFIERSFNNMGDLLGVSFYDQSGEPYCCKDGYAEYSNIVDSMGNITVTRYLDEAGNLTECSEGYAIVVKDYNMQGKVCRETFYNAEKELIDNQDGKASEIQYIYDDNGKEKYKIYYDQYGEEITRTTLLIRLSEIWKNYPAENAGIQDGDYLIKYNEWNIFDYDDLEMALDDLSHIVAVSTEVEKKLVIGRSEGENRFTFFEATCETGKMGVRINDWKCNQEIRDNLEQQYKRWMEEKI